MGVKYTKNLLRVLDSPPLFLWFTPLLEPDFNLITRR